MELTIPTSDLSDQACYALIYALASVPGAPVDKVLQFKAADAKLRLLTTDDKRRMLRTGLLELLEKHVIDAEKDGHSDLVVTKVHMERLDTGRLITADGA